MLEIGGRTTWRRFPLKRNTQVCLSPFCGDKESLYKKLAGLSHLYHRFKCVGSLKPLKIVHLSVWQLCFGQHHKGVLTKTKHSKHFCQRLVEISDIFLWVMMLPTGNSKDYNQLPPSAWPPKLTIDFISLAMVRRDSGWPGLFQNGPTSDTSSWCYFRSFRRIIGWILRRLQKGNRLWNTVKHNK